MAGLRPPIRISDQTKDSRQTRILLHPLASPNVRGTKRELDALIGDRAKFLCHPQVSDAFSPVFTQPLPSIPPQHRNTYGPQRLSKLRQRNRVSPARSLPLQNRRPSISPPQSSRSPEIDLLRLEPPHRRIGNDPTSRHQQNPYHPSPAKPSPSTLTQSKVFSNVHTFS